MRKFSTIYLPSGNFFCKKRSQTTKKLPSGKFRAKKTIKHKKITEREKINYSNLR